MVFFQRVFEETPENTMRKQESIGSRRMGAENPSCLDVGGRGR